MEGFGLAVTLLTQGGPWAIVAFLGWAYYKKDQQQQKERERTLELVEKHISSVTKLEGAVTSMNGVLTIVANQHMGPRN